MLKYLQSNLWKVFFAMWVVVGINSSWAQISIGSSTAVTENFNTMSTTSQTGSLPSNWKMSAAGNGTAAGWTTSSNVTATTVIASSGTPSTGGRYNFGDGTTNTDRSPGFLTSSGYASPNSIMAYYKNTFTAAINQLAVTYVIERYKINSAAASTAFSYSTDGSTWTAVPSSNLTFTAASPATYGFPIDSQNGTATITGLNIAVNGSFYLKWNFDTTGSNSQGLGLDNVSVTATFANTPVYTLTPSSLSGFTYVQGSGPSASQSFTVAGSNLTAGGGTIAVTGSTNYQVSTDNSTWGASANITYTGNSLTATTVYVRLKSGLSTGTYNSESIGLSGGGTTGSVSVGGNVTAPTPSLAITGSTTAHGTSCVGVAATPIQYTITNTGTGAAAGITVTSSNSSEFTVSGLSGPTIPVNGSVTYVVTFKPTASGSRSATITVASTTTTSNSPTSSLTGTGTTAAAPTITGATSGSVGSLTATLSATATVNNCSGAISAYGFYYSTSSGFANGAGTQVAGTNITSGGAYSVNLTGLQPSTVYFYKAFATNSTNTTYTTQGTFTTTAYTVAAPVATAATGIVSNSFIANWDAVSNATNYRLDVYQGTEIATSVTEGFESGLANAYPSSAATYVLGTGTWEIGEGRTSASSTFVISGTTSLQTRNSTYFITPSFTKITSISFKSKISSTTGIDIKIQKIVAGVTTDLQTVTSAASTTSSFTIPVNEIASDVKIKVTVLDAGTVAFDDVTINYIQGNETFISPYQNYTVAGTSQLVSGLSPETTYKYRVRAVNSTYSVTSANSNIINVTTGKELVWNGTTWTGGATPTNTDSGTITGAYSTATNGNLTIGNLTVSSTGSVHVTANTTLTVANALNNQATASNFIVDDNGALVQTNNVANSGSITVHKNSSALYRQDYTLWSAPTSGIQTLASFAPGTLDTRFYEYDAKDSGSGYTEAYYHVDPATTTFAPAHSYLIRMPNGSSATNYNGGTGTLVVDGQFTGTPNNGTITRNLNMQANKFTATGNPYPSPIGVSEFFSANSSVIDAGSGIYLWRKKNSGTTGSYATVSNASYTFNTSNGTATGGQENAGYFAGASSTWRIAPGQGFIVKTNSNATGTPQLTFNNTMRKAAPGSGGQSFFRVGAGTATVSRYWISIANSTGDAGQFTVAYLDDATNGLDYGYDAVRLEESNTLSAYTIAENKSLTIQARPEFVSTDVVATGYTAPAAGTYTLSLNNSEGTFAQGQLIYIKDNSQNVVRELSANNSYSFSTEAGTFNDRFEIVYTNQVLNTDTPANTANVAIYRDKTGIVANAGANLINGIEIYDIQGRRLYANSKVNTANYAVTNLTAAHEVLIVKVATDKGTVSKKIIF
ncbi:MAG: beta strand repeat-containing protein [Bacteroidia bacterium]